ncbi:putative small GTPase, P-loop containing nucleoside triphosphate hydrolase [Helianthus anomalus]
MRMPLIRSFCFLVLVDIRNWIRNIEQHASDNVNKTLVGNKADMDGSKRVFYICSLSHTHKAQ